MLGIFGFMLYHLSHLHVLRVILNDHSIGHSFNAIFGRVGHIASEAVIVELVNSKCLPTLLYGLEACPLKSADLKSLDYIVAGAFIKMFKTKSKEVASCCMEMFNCPLPSVSVNSRKCQFLQKCSASENNMSSLC